MSTQAQDPGHEHSEEALRAEALESLLVEKGLVDSREIDEVVSRYETDIGPMNGAKVVARAWVDPEFKKRLLADGAGVVRELGLANFDTGALQVVENTAEVHNVVVCTLCSCYPWSMLGLPPTWYKSFEYRSRVVREPRAVLREFGLELDDSVEVRVWDSSSELRYLVLPERPAGTEGYSEDQLAALVTRDSMVGVARATEPA